MTVTFPATPLAIRIRIQLAGVWTDITSYVRFDAGVTCRRGAMKEHTKAPAASCDLVLNNQAVKSRRFSPKNTTGPYYGKLRRYTPIWVEYDFGEGYKTRFTGKVPEWKPDFTMATDGTARVRAFGKLHDIFDRATPPINSPMYDTITAANPVQYWPLEGSLNSAVRGGPPINGYNAAVTGVNYTGNSSLPGSKPNITVSDTTTLFITFSHAFSGHWQADWFMNIPAAPAADTVMMRLYQSNGAIALWNFTVGATTYRLQGLGPTGTVLVDSGAISNSGVFFNQWMHCRISCRDEGGGTIRWLFTRFPVPIGIGFFETNTASIAYGDLGGWNVPAQAGIDGISYGHWAAHDKYDFSATDQSADGYDGEYMLTRYARLLNQAGIAQSTLSQVMNYTTMGVQGSGELGALLRECETVAEGMIVEDVNDTVMLMDASWFASGAVGLTVPYSSVFDVNPTEDDFALVNRFTASGANNLGTSVATLDTGNLSTADIGIVPGGDTYNLHTASHLEQHAHFRLMQGTIDDQRLESIVVDFAKHPELLSNYALNFDVGTRIQVTSPTGHLGPDTIDQLALGYSETFTNLTLRATFYTAPFAAYDTGVLDDTTKRLDCGASYLAEDLDTTETGVDVSIFDGCVWGHNDGDYTITIGGEDMTVTAVGAVTSTITFVSAGTAAAANAAAVVPGLPAGAAAGNLLLVFATARDTNNNPGLTCSNGYTKLWDAGNAALFGKVHSGSESAPTVDFSNGVGDTVIAQMAAFTGGWGDLTHAVMVANWQSNGTSAQNIAYPSVEIPLPNSLLLWLGWKADDWTSVATLADATAEIGESFSTLGNDAGIVWDYRILTDRRLYIPGVFTVTGGASQISIGAALVLRATKQTLTVTRSVNGAALTHSIGDPVHVKYPIRLAL